MSAGRIVGSKYCLLYELGRGGMGSVWLAEHLTLRSHVAVKLLGPALAANVDALRRFEREARAAATLRGPHVVQVLDFGVEKGDPYLVMEYLEGESLGRRLAQVGSLPAADVWTVMNQLRHALVRAHREGFVHRDIKPDNVFLVDDGPGFFVKVLDFGIAKALDSALTTASGSITQTGALIGTPHHMSPEQAEGRAVDARSDIWSVGVLAFQCVTGELPFRGDSLPALLRSICFDPIVVPSHVAPVPLGFDAWFSRALARDRARRFQSVEELADSIEPILRRPVAEWVGPPTRSRGVTTTVRLETYPGEPAERRFETRVPSSIPAGINGQRDLRHTALIHNASRNGALLATRYRCAPGQLLSLKLHLSDAQRGEEFAGEVVRVVRREGDPIWRFDVGVKFRRPLHATVIEELERRAERRRRPPR